MKTVILKDRAGVAVAADHPSDQGVILASLADVLIYQRALHALVNLAVLTPEEKQAALHARRRMDFLAAEMRQAAVEDGAERAA